MKFMLENNTVRDAISSVVFFHVLCLVKEPCMQNPQMLESRGQNMMQTSSIYWFNKEFTYKKQSWAAAGQKKGSLYHSLPDHQFYNPLKQEPAYSERNCRSD